MIAFMLLFVLIYHFYTSITVNVEIFVMYFLDEYEVESLKTPQSLTYGFTMTMRDYSVIVV